MIPKRVFFWSDKEQASDAERDLLAQYRDEIEDAILQHGSDDADTIPTKGGETAFLTNIPKPIIGRVMARWVFLNADDALVTGVRTGDAFEVPDKA